VYAGGALALAGKVAAATGARLYCENAFARLDRGSDLPDVQRLPYFPEVRRAGLLGAACR
jgi:acetolactate synthase-1/2/3 large subunit